MPQRQVRVFSSMPAALAHSSRLFAHMHFRLAEQAPLACVSRLSSSELVESVITRQPGGRLLLTEIWLSSPPDCSKIDTPSGVTYLSGSRSMAACVHVSTSFTKARRLPAATPLPSPASSPSSSSEKHEPSSTIE
jgi:hypothetical protein